MDEDGNYQPHDVNLAERIQNSDGRFEFGTLTGFPWIDIANTSLKCKVKQLFL
jgi:hypothetical protein